MKNILIPIGLPCFIGLFVFALVHTARKQQRAKTGVFRDFADRRGLRHLETDDGRAERFAGGFDGIGRFRSASLGKVTPKDVVDGVVKDMEVLLFRHGIRYSEGWAREWFVAGVTSAAPLAQRCSVQFCKQRADKAVMHLVDPVVNEGKLGSFNLVVRAPSVAYAGRILDGDVLEQIARRAGHLSLRPEIQVRRNRISAYFADRNAAPEDEQTLAELVEFVQLVARIGNQAEGS